MKKVIRKIMAVGTTAALTTMTLGGAIAADLTNFEDTFSNSGSAVVIGDGATADEAAQTTLYEYLGGVVGGEEVPGGEFEAIEVDIEKVVLGNNVAAGAVLDTVYTDDDGFTILQDDTITIDGTSYDFHDEIQLLSTNGSLDIETGLSRASIDDDYEDNIGFEIRKDGLKYCWVIDKSIDYRAHVSSAHPWDMTFMGEPLKVTSITDNDTLTAEVGDRYVMNPGDSIEVEGIGIELISSDSTSAILNIGEDEGRDLSEGNTITYGELDVYLSSATDATNKDDKVVVLVVGLDAVKTYNDADEYKDFCSPEGGFGYSGCTKSDPDWIWDIKGLNVSGGSSGSTVGSDVTTNALCIENDFVADDWDDGLPSVGEGYTLPNNFASVGIDSLTVDDDDYLTVTAEYDSNSDLSTALTSATSNNTLFISAPNDEAFEIVRTVFNETGLTSDVKTDKLWLYRAGPNSSGGGNNTVYVFYEDTDNKVRHAGNLTFRNNSPGDINGWARLNYKDTKATDVQLALMFNESTANGAYFGFRPAQSLVTVDDLWLQLRYAIAGEFTGLGASANTADAADLTYNVATPVTATSANQIGTKDENHRTKYGIVINDPKAGLGNDKLVIKIPGDQVKAEVAVWQGIFKGTADEEEEEEETTTADVPELLEASEVEDVEAWNLVLVGGPCVNSLTADFLGLAAGSCGEDSGLVADEAVVEMMANGESFAALVYGWEAADTTRATNAVVDETWELAEDKMSATVA